MEHAAAYIRVSSKPQADGVSLETQRLRCESFAEARGWELHLYEDVQSARTADRPQLRELRRHLSQYHAVLFWKLDRAFRSTTDCLALLQECQAAHTDFVSVEDGFDSSTPTGQAMITVIAAFAQLESDTIGQRVRATKATLFDQGKLPWRTLYGYNRSEDGRAEVNEEEAAVVRRIFEQRDAGHSQQQIADALTAEGVEKRGRRWTRSAVNQVLHNPAYIGSPLIGRMKRNGRGWESRPKSEWQSAPGLTPAIVSQRLWERTRRRGLRGRRPSRPALFRGLLICGKCGSRIHANTYTNYRERTVYVCGNRRKCNMSSVEEGALAQRFERALEQLRPADVSLELPDREYRTEEFGQAHAVSERAKELYIEGLISREELDQRLAQMKRATEAVNECIPRQATEQDLQDIATKYNKAVKAKDIDAANRKLRQIIARIVVRQDPPGMELVFWAE